MGGGLYIWAAIGGVLWLLAVIALLRIMAVVAAYDRAALDDEDRE